VGKDRYVSGICWGNHLRKIHKPDYKIGRWWGIKFVWVVEVKYNVRHGNFGFSKKGTGRMVSTNEELACMSDAILKLTHISERNHSTKPSLHDSV